MEDPRDRAVSTLQGQPILLVGGPAVTSALVPSHSPNSDLARFDQVTTMLLLSVCHLLQFGCGANPAPFLPVNRQILGYWP